MDAISRRPRKNPWDIVFMPLGVAAAYYVFSRPIVILRRIGMPADTFFASTASELSVLLFLLGLGLVALGPGFILSNLIQRTIPYLRTLQNRLNHPQGDQAFKQATKGLLKFSLGAFVLIYPLSILGGLNYYALSPDGVFYRPWFALHVIHYQWRQVKDIETACYHASKGTNGQYIVVFDDGRSIDLNAFSTRDFFAGYATVSKFLSGVPFHFRFDEQKSESCPKSWLPYFRNRP